MSYLVVPVIVESWMKRLVRTLDIAPNSRRRPKRAREAARVCGYRPRPCQYPHHRRGVGCGRCIFRTEMYPVSAPVHGNAVRPTSISPYHRWILREGFGLGRTLFRDNICITASLTRAAL